MPYRLEGSEVVLQSGDEGYVLDGACGGGGGEEVAHHGAVDADVLSFGRLPKPGGDEDMRGLEVSDGGGEVIGIEQIGSDEVDAFEAGGWAAGEAVDLPAFGEQMLCEVVSHDAGDSGYECYGWHLCPLRRPSALLGLDEGRCGSMRTYRKRLALGCRKAVAL